MKEVRRAEAILIRHLREVRRKAVRIPLPAEVQAQVALLRTTLRIRAAAHRLVHPHRVPAEVPLLDHIAVEAADAAAEGVVEQ